jgi:TPR repeat protein
MWLGNMYMIGLGVPKNPSRAEQAYQKACDLGNAASCVSLANMYTNGSGLPEDRARAALLRQKACDLGDSKMCGNVTPSGRE